MIFYVFQMFHSANIAILLRYFDISVIGFVILFGYCTSVFEIYCTSAVNIYILPSPRSYCNSLLLRALDLLLYHPALQRILKSSLVIPVDMGKDAQNCYHYFFCVYCSIKAYKSFGQKRPVMLQGREGQSQSYQEGWKVIGKDVC